MILVTGGCGYIGSHTIVDLVNNGYNVISIDNFSNSSEDTVINIQKIIGNKFINYNIDLCNLDALDLIFKTNNITEIIHFAAFKSVPNSVLNPIEYYNNNINSLLNLLICSEKYNIKKFIFSSSCSIFYY